MARRKAPPTTQQADGAPEPDAELVMALYEAGKDEQDEAKLRTTIRTARAMTEMEHPVRVPRAYQAITRAERTPFVRDTWQRLTAALTQHPPIPHIEPRGKAEYARDAANIGERWTTAAMLRMNRERGEDVPTESVKQLVRDMESVIKVVHKPDAFATFPERAEHEDADTYLERVKAFDQDPARRFGIAWTTVDRLSCIFGEGEFGDEFVIEYGEYPIPLMARKYGMVYDKDQRRLRDPKYALGGLPRPEGDQQTAKGRCVKVEYWDAHWCVILIDGEMAPGYPKPNPYGPRLPYFRAKSDGALYPLLPLQAALDSALTMWRNWGYLAAYPTPVLESVPQAANSMVGDFPDLSAGEPVGTAGGNQPRPLTWQPGKYMDLRGHPGTTFRFLEPPPIGQDIEKLVGLYRSMIDLAGISSVFRGAGGGESGYAVNQLIQASTVTFRRLADAQQRQLEAIGEFLWWIVRHRIKAPVYVLASGEESGRTWLGLKPEGQPTATTASVEHLGPLTFRMRAMLETDRQARTMVATQKIAAGLSSKRRALEQDLGEENPDDILDEIAVENALDNDPTLNGQWVQKALVEAGIIPPPPPPQPALPSPLVGPDGMPLPMSPGMAGVAAPPSIPGLTMPLRPQPPQASARVPGGFPGRPGNQGPSAFPQP